MTAIITPTKKHARKVLELVNHGLVKGLGSGKPGDMCVEAAVNAAFGLPHSDSPPCVGSAVRAFKIALNDCEWPSNADRTNGMRKLAIAQLGSNTLDQMAFGKTMYLRGVQKILPFIWRKEAEKVMGEKKKAMLEWCEKMEAVADFDAAEKLATAASASASASASAFASAYASASAFASAYAYAYAFATAYAYAYAFAYNHELLKLVAQVGLEVLIEMKSPGCAWLDLCEIKTSKRK
jgi:hypothetical protein